MHANTLNSIIRALFIGLGETDEFAHHGQYDMYLQQANGNRQNNCGFMVLCANSFVLQGINDFHYYHGSRTRIKTFFMVSVIIYLSGDLLKPGSL